MGGGHPQSCPNYTTVMRKHAQRFSDILPVPMTWNRSFRHLCNHFTYFYYNVNTLLVCTRHARYYMYENLTLNYSVIMIQKHDENECLESIQLYKLNVIIFAV